MQPAIATNSAAALSHTGVFVNRSATNTARNPTAMKKMAMLAASTIFVVHTLRRKSSNCVFSVAGTCKRNCEGTLLMVLLLQFEF